jgi:hypothetical protein
VFGNVRFRLWNTAIEKTAAQTEVTVDGRPAMSDANGYVQLSIPLSEQKVSYPVVSQSIKIIGEGINMPCGPDDVVLFENK